MVDFSESRGVHEVIWRKVLHFVYCRLGEILRVLWRIEMCKRIGVR
jgi:hypothetical protein